jgi:hypothetical protein
VEPYLLEVPYAPREAGQSLLLALSVTFVLGGITWALVAASALPLGIAAIGCTLYAALLIKHPPYQYIVAVRIDNEGIWYLREPRPGAASSKLSWGEVKSLSVRLTSQGEEAPGLEVTTTRFGPKGISVVVPIGGEAECLAALRAAQEFFSLQRSSAA